MKNSQTVEESVAQYTKAWNEKELSGIRAGIEICCDHNATYIDAQNPNV